MNLTDNDKTLRYVALLRDFGAHIVNYCNLHSDSMEEARELQQEVLIAVWEHIEDILDYDDPKKKNRWLRKVMRTTFVRHLRRQPLFPLVPLHHAAEVADSPDYDAELLDEVMAALTPDEQQLMQLRFDGYRNDEIAVMLGTNKNTIDQRFFRIYFKLKKRYATPNDKRRDL